MTPQEFEANLRNKALTANQKATDTSLPARYRESFALRSEVYQEILADFLTVEEVQA